MSAASNRIRELNDAYRATSPATGTWLVTIGVQSMGATAVMEAVAKVQNFDEFTPDNDPHGEHDFGRFEVNGQILYWKIDYYDRDLVYGSPDPADPAVTKRVLTILLASEY
ncbi:DUF3768 domain-containing protein [Sphingomonas sp. AOB5]|uniref:DUF3768 domain-containing protein n=1 Tax=Sphingomonas sp. AOB5 TaxID=3034017 RepID=UPI0023F6BFF9|nr:DUF3768 domain-containing protein [Sphingomonas sp. AOB5]MDF7774268.1 DUF3768 domain-containing protein [Sphingomonas sp. AOB5]